jgi:hypothetical protein
VPLFFFSIFVWPYCSNIDIKTSSMYSVPSELLSIFFWEFSGRFKTIHGESASRTFQTQTRAQIRYLCCVIALFTLFLSRSCSSMLVLLLRVLLTALSRLFAASAFRVHLPFGAFRTLVTLMLASDDQLGAGCCEHPRSSGYLKSHVYLRHFAILSFLSS